MAKPGTQGSMRQRRAQSVAVVRHRHPGLAGGLEARLETALLLGGASLLALGLLIAGPAGAQDRSNLIDSQHNGGSGPLEIEDDQSVTSAVSATSSEDDGTDFLGGILNSAVSAIAGVVGIVNPDTGNPDQRANAVTDSFNNYDGTPIVQQNTGDFSAIAGASERITNASNVGSVDQSATATASVDLLGTPITDVQTDRSNLINPSFNGASGAALVQQNNGNGAALSAADSVVEVLGDTGTVEQAASASATVANVNAAQGTGSRANTIDSSFTDYTGEAKVQQNNGDGSALSAAQAVATLGGDATAIGQSAMATGAVSGNVTSDAGATRENDVTGSFGNATGAFTVQQNNGNGSALAASTALITTVDGAAPPPPGNEENQEGQGGQEGQQQLQLVALPADESTAQGSEVSGESSGNAASAGDGTRRNSITDSFNGSTGVSATVQQNNGDNAVLGAAHTIIVDSAGADFGPAASLATLQSTVSGNTSSISPTVNGGYSNNIVGSFNQSRVLAVTAQQNNGANSVLGSSISIRTGPGVN